MDKERWMANRSAIGPRGRCAVAIFVGLLTVALSAGCGAKSRPEIKGKLPLFPVTGKLMLDSQPMAGATILFHPTQEFPAGAAKQRPRAMVDTDGTFHVSTYANDDGAPAGEYKVTVSWKGDLTGITSEQAGDLPEKAPMVVQEASSSRLRIKVKEAENSLPTWDLTELEPHASNTP
jgi:hypothetical protein